MKVIEVNLEKKQIQLSIKAAQSSKPTQTERFHSTKSEKGVSSAQQERSPHSRPKPEGRPDGRFDKRGDRDRKFDRSSSPRFNRSEHTPASHYTPPKDNFKNNPFAALAGLKKK